MCISGTAIHLVLSFGNVVCALCSHALAVDHAEDLQYVSSPCLHRSTSSAEMMHHNLQGHHVAVYNYGAA